MAAGRERKDEPAGPEARTAVDPARTAVDPARPAVDPARPAVAPTLAGIALRLQRAAGNRAARAVLARDDTAAPPKAAPTPTPATKTLAQAVANKDLAGIVAMPDYWDAKTDERRQAIELLVSQPSLTDADKVAIKRLWEDGGSDLVSEMVLSSSLWWRCVDKGVPLDRWTGADGLDLWIASGAGVITEFQAKRVPDAVDRLSKEEFKLLRIDLWLAGSMEEKAFIAKALAAGRTMADVDAFSDAIRYKDTAWLHAHLNVVEEDPKAKTGPGIRQQWQMSCGPTSVQVLHAQTDPIYALKLTGGGDVSQVGKNKVTKKEQGDILKGHGSVPTALGTPGTGAWVEDDINALKAETGLTYTWTPVNAVTPTNPKNGDVEKALGKIRGWLAEGIYIPIVIGGSPGNTAHYNVILRYDPKRGYLVHDPAQAYSAWVTGHMFMTNALNPPLAWSVLAGYDTPKKVPKPKPKPLPKKPPAAKKP